MKTALNLRHNHTNNNAVKIRIAALVLVTLLALSLKGSCADSTRQINHKNAFYAGMTTQGNRASLNYERTFRQKHAFSYSYSAGIAVKGKNVYVPFSLNAITTGKQHHFEMGLGITLFTEEHTYAKKKADLDKKGYLNPTIGYRYQKATGGIFFKACAGPQFLIDPPAYNIMAATVAVTKPSAQIALGISF